jgi:hypothetical protein
MTSHIEAICRMLASPASECENHLKIVQVSRKPGGVTRGLNVK